MKFTEDELEIWHNSITDTYSINPRTNNKIKINGPVYKILEKEYNDFEIYNIHLGSGGFSDVYLGKYRKEKVAVKKIREKVQDNRIEIAKKEIEQMKKVIDCKNVIKFKGFEIDKDGFSCIIMEYASNGDLMNFLKNNKNLQLEAKDLIISDIISAINYLHEKGIYHEDLKSQNILVNEYFCFKLADFGLSRNKYSIITNTKGSPAWMSPERLRNEKEYNKEKSEIYSLGMVIWEVFTTKIPFEELTNYTIIFEVALNKKTEEILDEIPDIYKEIITNCWKYDPNERLNIDYLTNIIKNRVEDPVNINNFIRTLLFKN